MSDPIIDDYLSAHHQLYSRELLIDKLIAAGHDRAAIEAAWERLARSPSGPTSGPIDDYIWANVAGYSRDAITRALLAAGHDKAAIEAGWNRVAQSRPRSAGGQREQTIVRTYEAKTQADAAKLFQADARRMAAAGYYPTSQSWAQGQWGCGAFLLALILAIVLIGLIIFIYLLVVKPDGTLTVVYALRDAAVSVAAEPRPQSTPALRLNERLADLQAARDAGLITDDEYTDRRKRILDDL